MGGKSGAEISSVAFICKATWYETTLKECLNVDYLTVGHSN